MDSSNSKSETHFHSKTQAPPISSSNDLDRQLANLTVRPASSAGHMTVLRSNSSPPRIPITPTSRPNPNRLQALRDQGKAENRDGNNQSPSSSRGAGSSRRNEIFDTDPRGSKRSSASQAPPPVPSPSRQNNSYIDHQPSPSFPPHEMSLVDQSSSSVRGGALQLMDQPPSSRRNELQLMDQRGSYMQPAQSSKGSIISNSRALIGDQTRTYCEGLKTPSQATRDYQITSASAKLRVGASVAPLRYLVTASKYIQGIPSYPENSVIINPPSYARPPSGVKSVFTKPEDYTMAARQSKINSLKPEERRVQEVWAQKVITRSKGCPEGFKWTPYNGYDDKFNCVNGYLCAGGHHFMSHDDVASGFGGVWLCPGEFTTAEGMWGPYYRDPKNNNKMVYGGLEPRYRDSPSSWMIDDSDGSNPTKKGPLALQFGEPKLREST